MSQERFVQRVKRGLASCGLRVTAIGITALLVATACSKSLPPPEIVSAPPDNSSAPEQTGISDILSQSMPAEDPHLLIRARFPTALAVSPSRQLFFAEREGRIWKVDLSGGKKDKEPPVHLIEEIAVSTEGERGLLGLALDPDFVQHPYLYVFASPASNKEISTVHRIELKDDQVVKDEVIIELPAGRACCHKGGRLAFGPDGKLYVTVGDGMAPSASPDINDLRGKILRYEPDGSIPRDGAFGPQTPVWATGLRNSFGLVFSSSGEAYATDNGPSGSDGPHCCDEVNRVRPGEHYGWPNSYGSRYREGTPPIWHSGEEVVVPTGITVVSSSRFGALNGAVAFCSFALRQMFVIDEAGRKWTEGLSEPGRGPSGCALDIVQGPDARLYFADTDAIYAWG